MTWSILSGVPLAGIQSYDIFQSSGIGADTLNMAIFRATIADQYTHFVYCRSHHDHDPLVF